VTRTDAFKAVYFVRFGCLLLALIVANIASRKHLPALEVASFAVFAVLLLSGRVQAYFWSDLLAGLHHLNRREYEKSKARSERFIAQLRERPWLRHLVWLATSSYSASAEVLALNNLAAAEIGLGEFEAARAHLARAIDLDPKCPLLFKNMGAIVLRTGSTADAMPWIDRAAALGLRGDWTDRAAQASQRRNADLSTTGTVAGPQPPLSKVGAALRGAYIVQLLNDDATPLEFVVSALEQVFGLTGAEAIRIALAAHQFGRAACAAFDDECTAKSKADELAALARENGHALTCLVAARIWD
jgi:ATP-dependent Clp protease adapter protein ClpS